MNKVVTKEVAEQIANWWADKICGRVKFDNGDDSETGFMTSMLATMLAKPTTDEQREKFVKALSGRIEGKEYLMLSVDYHPDEILRESAEEAGISEGNFPWKTYVIMDRCFGEEGYRIRARHGYCAEPEILYEC